MNPLDPQLKLLIARYIEGRLSSAESAELQHRLKEDGQARAGFVAMLDLHAMLVGDPAIACEILALADVRQGEEQPSKTTFLPAFMRPTIVRWLAVASGVLAAAVVVSVISWRSRVAPVVSPPAPEGLAEATDDGVAVLLNAPGAEWEEMGVSPRPGDSLPVGRLRLKSGLAQIQFYGGATVIFEGPADFQLISTQEAYCTRGKLRATVPPRANGFTIGSPKLDLVDLGTEFGLRVDEGAQTEVHVFQGKVELYAPGSGRAGASRRELTTGRGLRVDESGTGKPIASNPLAFRTTEQLVDLAESEARRRYQAWLAASERLRRDPRLLLYYTFQTDRPWNRTLVDRVQGRREPWNGVIVGCEWTRGRWPDKQALEFKRPGDCVRINVPGKYESITLMAWVRLDSVENRYNGLLVTDHFGGGWLHWQIQKTQNLHLAMMPATGKHDVFASPPIMGPAYFGQWTHLAAVYDHQAGTATHYINGRPLSSHKIRFPHAIQFGSAAIGNWGAPRPGHPNQIRNLNGRIDEFLLFKEPLDAQEIHDLYQAGKLHSS